MHGLKIKSGTTLAVEFRTYSEDALADADALPTGVLRINGSTAEPLVTITGHGEAPAGVYLAQVTVEGPGGATLMEGARFELIAECQIAGKPQRETIGSGQIVASHPGEIPAAVDTQLSGTHGEGSWEAGAAQVLLNVVPSIVHGGEVKSGPIVAYIAAGDSRTIILADQQGQPIDMQGVSLRLVVEDPDSGADLFVKTTGDGLTIGGADNNLVTVTYTDGDVATIGNYLYALRTAGGGKMWAEGPFAVRKAAN